MDDHPNWMLADTPENAARAELKHNHDFGSCVTCRLQKGICCVHCSGYEEDSEDEYSYTV